MPRGKMTEEAKQARRQRMEAKKVEEQPVIVPAEVDNVAEMNDLALRIFDGQSPDLGKKERVLRIVRGLNAQGYTDMSGLNLPLTDYKHYL